MVEKKPELVAVYGKRNDKIVSRCWSEVYKTDDFGGAYVVVLYEFAKQQPLRFSNAYNRSFAKAASLKEAKQWASHFADHHEYPKGFLASILKGLIK